MATYVKEFGKQWDERVPRGAISWLINRLHVGVSDDAIEKNIRERIANSPQASEYTASLIEQSVAYAIECHHQNQATYRAVNGGSFIRELMKSAPNGLK